MKKIVTGALTATMVLATSVGVMANTYSLTNCNIGSSNGNTNYTNGNTNNNCNETGYYGNFNLTSKGGILKQMYGCDYTYEKSKPVRPAQPPICELPSLPKPPVTVEPPICELPDLEKPVNPEKPSQSTELEAMAAEVASLVNAERAKAGLSPLVVDVKLQDAALVRSIEQVEVFSHTRPNGSSCFTVLDEAGITYRSAGENIAKGQKTAAQVMDSWMNSEGHRANILSGNFTTIGVGVYKEGNTIYWTQLFIK